MLLGDLTQAALEKVGVTEELVSAWLGRPCNCEERRQKLNVLDSFARRILSGKMERAGEFLKSLIGD